MVIVVIVDVEISKCLCVCVCIFRGRCDLSKAAAHITEE